MRVGTHQRVGGGAWVSCCTTVIELEVEDVAGNIIRTVQDQRYEDHWHIIIPVVIIIGIIFLIIITVVSICVCKRRYNQLSSEYI